MTVITGTAGNDTLTGTPSSDTFVVHQGGTDVINGLEGRDIIGAGAAFDATDRIDGGQDYDRLDLSGEYSAGLTLGSQTLRNVEEIRLGAGFGYGLITDDATVNAGAVLKIDGSEMSAGTSFYVDGSAETDGEFLMYDSSGDDTLIGGTGTDTFHIGNGGADTVRAGDDDTGKHNEVIFAYGAFSSDDVIDGGSRGYDWDTIALRGDYSAGLAITAPMITNIESLNLSGGFVYSLSAASTSLRIEVRADGITGDGHVRFDGSAGGRFTFWDSIGDDTLIGGRSSDQFIGREGGSDTFSGGGGNDRFDMNGAFDVTDRIDGGTGSDTLQCALYVGGIYDFDALTIRNIEKLDIPIAYNGSFKIMTDDANVGPGSQLEVLFPRYYGDQRYEFDGSAETDGTFKFNEGYGDDVFTGGSQADQFILRYFGNEVMAGRGGDDVFYVSAGFTAADQLDGGSGSDSLYLSQDVEGGLKLGAQTITDIETVILSARRSYTLTTNDANIAAGGQFTLDGQLLEAGDVVRFNGSDEIDGQLLLLGGAGDDVMRAGALTDSLTGGEGADKLIGGDGADLLTGGLGGDYLYGGEGRDRFLLEDVTQSTVAGADWIRDWNAGDRIGLSEIDADTGVAGDQAFTFIGAGAFTAAGQLQAVTTASQNTIVRGDFDGDGGADFMIKLTGVQSLSAGSFIL